MTQGIRPTGAVKAPEEVRAGLIRQITAYRTSKCLYAVTELGIPDLLADGPMTATDLAAATGTRPDPLRRVIDHLVTVGVLQTEPSGAYANTPSSLLLGRDAPDGLANWVRCELQEGYWHSWDRLVDQIRTGRTAFELVHGKSFFEWLSGSPESAALFDATMRDGSRDLDHGVVSTIGVRPGETIVDVGGGDGSFLAALLQANPEARGVLFELPHERSEIAPQLAEFVQSGRCRVDRGSFFVGVPPGGDLYVLKRILHDWDDDDAVRVLRHCREAVRPGGRVAVVDIVLQDDVQAPVGRSLDVLMMVLMGGRERTEAEFADLGESAGLVLNTISPTSSSLSVLELLTPAMGGASAHAGR